MVTAIAAAFEADALAGGLGEGADHLRGDGLGTGVLEHGLGALGIGLRLVPDSLETLDAILERRVAEIDDTSLDDVIEALEASFGLRRTPVQFANVLMRGLGSLLPPVAPVARIVSSLSGWRRRSSRWLATTSSS